MFQHKMGWLTNLAVVLAVTGNIYNYFDREMSSFPPFLIILTCSTVPWLVAGLGARTVNDNGSIGWAVDPLTLLLL